MKEWYSPVVEIFVVVLVGGELVVVNPDIGCFLNSCLGTISSVPGCDIFRGSRLTNSIGRSNDLLNLESTDDNVADIDDSDPDIDQGFAMLVPC